MNNVVANSFVSRSLDSDHDGNAQELAAVQQSAHQVVAGLIERSDDFDQEVISDVCTPDDLLGIITKSEFGVHLTRVCAILEENGEQAQQIVTNLGKTQYGPLATFLDIENPDIENPDVPAAKVG